VKAWFVRLLIALDACAQVVFPYGIPGETISARAGKARRRGRRWGCVLCWMLDLIDTNHCAGAVQNDIKRAQAVIDDLSHD
jgi:hypothetical protein